MRSKRLEDIEKKIADLKALANDEKRRLSTKERKRETRRKILFTGEVYAQLKRDKKITLICEDTNGDREQVEFRSIHDVEKWTLQHLSRPQDFSAFDVDDLLDSKQETSPAKAVESKATKPKTAKPKAEPFTPPIPAATIPHPATFMVQGSASFPQSPTDEIEPPPPPATPPANSNKPKTAKKKAKRLPEVEQDELKKQFMM